MRKFQDRSLKYQKKITKMKKINRPLLPAAILSLLFFACSKDNNSSTGGACTISNPIVGKWNFASEIIDITTPDDDNAVSRDTTNYACLLYTSPSPRDRT